MKTPKDIVLIDPKTVGSGRYTYEVSQSAVIRPRDEKPPTPAVASKKKRRR